MVGFAAALPTSETIAIDTKSLTLPFLRGFVDNKVLAPRHAPEMLAIQHPMQTCLHLHVSPEAYNIAAQVNSRRESKGNSKS